ncbi:MAG: flavin reductase family protein [Actinobacteria bacterium]|nr:flavin reductase family protein [Actinomycetota bacterium]
MYRFTECAIADFQANPFHMIGKDWMLVTAAKADGTVNTMTAAWGGLGWMWEKPVAYIVIRPQRYTKEFIDESDTLSLSFLGKDYRKSLAYLGGVSGRDEDKIATSGLTIALEGGTPYFTESETVLICRKLYKQDFEPDCFIDASIEAERYPAKDYHAMYIVEVEKILVAE